MRPLTQLQWTGHDDDEVTIVGDRTGALKAFFDGHAESVLFVRPDRCIAGACIAQLAPELSAALFDVLCLVKGGERTHDGESNPGVAGAVLHVAQPTAESAGTVTRAP
jgi:3-(3-hydroxy-phenyl)propionate hydroxylase